MILLSIAVGVAAWFTLLGFVWLLSLIGLAQVAYIRGRYKWLVVLSIDYAFIAWVLDGPAHLIVMSAALPWVGYGYWLNMRRVHRKQRARLAVRH